MPLPSPGAAAATSRNIIDDQIVAALENLRDHMVEGWPELGIPPLDPLYLGYVNIDIHNNDTTYDVRRWWMGRGCWGKNQGEERR